MLPLPSDTALSKANRAGCYLGFPGASPIPTRLLSPKHVKSKAPSLHRHYPASAVVRASPPPHTAQPVSRELPVDPTCHLRWGFPCCLWSPLLACRRHYPGRFDGSCSLVLSHQHRPSPNLRRVGSCVAFFQACSAFTHVTACMLAKSPLRPSSPEASTASLPLPLLRLLPGGTNQFPGGTFTHCGPYAFARRTEKCRLEEG